MTVQSAHGFASLNGGTTGGAGGRSVTVSTGSALQAAIDSMSTAAQPLTIYVTGNITKANTAASEIVIDATSRLSIIGVGTSADFDGIGIRVKGGSSNIIIQNLKIHDVFGGVGDAISIEGPSKNIWIDSNELYSSLDAPKDYYDGLLDIKRGSEYITVSNNYIHDHNKVSLIGYSDDDAGARYVTYDHNYFENVGSRTPSVRFGYVHVYENYYDGIQISGINLRMGAVGLIENNVFANSENPIVSLDSRKIGFWDLRGNLFDNVTWSEASAGEAIASSNNSADTTQYNVPYAYTLLGAAKVKDYVTARAGTGNLNPVPDSIKPPSTPPAAQIGEAIKDTGDDDIVLGSPGNGSIDALGGDDDIVLGTAGNDSIDALGGDDQVDGGAGNDRILGGKGEDSLLGGIGLDTLLGGDGRDSLSGGEGNDSLDGGEGRDLLSGGGGNDMLLGGSGNDTLQGDAGNDTLQGGDGADILQGGLGQDVLLGGRSKDLFVFSAITHSAPGAAADRISDFSRGDRIDLSGIDADTSRAGDQAFVWIGEASFSGAKGQLRMVTSNDATQVFGDIDGDRQADIQISLNGFQLLIGSDFLL